jgi:hypothetical protein
MSERGRGVSKVLRRLSRLCGGSDRAGSLFPTGAVRARAASVVIGRLVGCGALALARPRRGGMSLLPSRVLDGFVRGGRLSMVRSHIAQECGELRQEVVGESD